MEKIFVVMQSTLDHDAYDNFGDFLLGVELGRLRFTNLYTFEYPENDFGEAESTDITYLSTASLTKQEQKNISSILLDMRMNHDLHDKRIIEIDNKKVYLYACYEDAINGYKEQNL